MSCNVLVPLLENVFIQEFGRNVVVSSCIEKTPNNNHTESMRVSSELSSERGKVIILLKQEMESALESLKEVQFEMARVQDEKEELKASEKRSLSNLNDLAAQFCNLETVMNNMEKQYEHKMKITDHKLKASNCLFLRDFNFFLSFWRCDCAFSLRFYDFFPEFLKLFYRLWRMN